MVVVGGPEREEVGVRMLLEHFEGVGVGVSRQDCHENSIVGPNRGTMVGSEAAEVEQ